MLYLYLIQILAETDYNYVVIPILWVVGTYLFFRYITFCTYSLKYFLCSYTFYPFLRKKGRYYTQTQFFSRKSIMMTSKYYYCQYAYHP